MLDLEENMHLNLHFDVYSKLLTDRQIQIYKLYYFDDCGLSEIGELLNITRQAVKSSLDNTTAYLRKLENELGIVRKKEKLENYLHNTNIPVSELKNILQILEEN